MDKKTAIDKVLTDYMFPMTYWEAVKRVASEAYDAGVASGAVQPEAPTEAPLTQWEYELLMGEKPGLPEKITTQEQLDLDWPEGTRIATGDSPGDVVYTRVNGVWRHDDSWKPWGTSWCPCGSRPEVITGYREGLIVLTLPEPEPVLWGFKVGDRVRYTARDFAIHDTRRVIGLYPEGNPEDEWRTDTPHIALGWPEDGDRMVGCAYSADEIEKVGN